MAGARRVMRLGIDTGYFGDLSLESDVYGKYAECIQCGAVFHKSELTRTVKVAPKPKLVKV